MIWVAIEDADTHEVTEFVSASIKQVLCLMAGHRADKHEAARFRLQDVEGDSHSHIVYEGVIYKGGFGYNIWVARKLIYI